jgi:hypothetical protein
MVTGGSIVDNPGAALPPSTCREVPERHCRKREADGFGALNSGGPVVPKTLSTYTRLPRFGAAQAFNVYTQASRSPASLALRTKPS